MDKKVCHYCGNVLEDDKDRVNPICESCVNEKIKEVKEEVKLVRKEIKEKIKDGTITHLPAKFNVILNLSIETMVNVNDSIDGILETVHECIYDIVGPPDLSKHCEIIQVYNQEDELIYDISKDED